MEARDEYFRLDRDGNGLREYATKFISTPGKHDGLYWRAESQANISPLDGLVEDANLSERSNEKPEPYNGYYFRILTAQRPAAPAAPFLPHQRPHDRQPRDGRLAGKLRRQRRRDFLGVENGDVYQKNLGPKAAALGATMREFNPDANWTVVEYCNSALAIDRRSASKPKHTPIGAMADEHHSPPVLPD